MFNIRSLQFDRSIVDGMQKCDDSETSHGWSDNAELPSTIFTIDFDPDEQPFPAGMVVENLGALRQDCLAKAHAEELSLLEYGVITCPSGLQFMRALEKKRQQPTGMAYRGTLTLIGQARFRITAWCFERGVTGLRDTMVMAQTEQGSIDPTRRDWGGWWVDPNDFGEQPLMQNVSESEKYDAQFPDHPLTRLRTLLKRFQESVYVEEAGDDNRSSVGKNEKLLHSKAAQREPVTDSRDERSQTETSKADQIEIGGELVDIKPNSPLARFGALPPRVHGLLITLAGAMIGKLTVFDQLERARRQEPLVSYSRTGLLVSVLVVIVGLVLLIGGDKAEKLLGKRGENRPKTWLEKVLIAVGLAVAFGLYRWVDNTFAQLGYH